MEDTLTFGQDTTVKDYLMVFNDENNKEIGRLSIKDNKLTFEGNADESAKIFFDTFKTVFNEYINRKEENHENYLKRS